MNDDQHEATGGELVAEDKSVGSDYLKMVMPMTVAAETYNQLQEFYKRHLVEGRDYGTVPGIDRPFLHQPGAQNLGMVYGLRPEFRISDKSDMTLIPPFLDYDVVCTLYSQKSGVLRGEGVGNCNSWESKYRYRYLKPTCPHCNTEAVIKGKVEYGGGWLCHKKQGGCGRKWKDGDQEIEGQPLGKTENIDVADQKNTILKMAKKRAYVDAILTTTAASGIFTQDPEAVGGSSPEDVVASQANAQTKRSAQPETASHENGIAKTIKAFADLGVSQDTIEEYFDRPAEEWDEGHFDVLREKYQMIKAGAYPAEDAFPPPETGFNEPESVPIEIIEAEEEKPKKAKK